MRRHQPENERAKRAYFTFLEQAKKMSPESVDQVAAAITSFEESTSYRDFRQFHIAQAIAFKRRLQDHVNPETGKPLAKATIRARLMAVKAFIHWLAGRPGYRSRIAYSDAEYFNLSANDERIASAVRVRPAPSIDDIRQVLAAMPTSTVIERRDRAVVAFALVSGARDNAIASLSIKHVDPERRTIFQDARSVRTKNAKTFTSTFFPVGTDFQAVVIDWLRELAELGFGPDDPLFPATRIAPGPDRRFVPTGLDRKHWKDAGPIRRIFKAACAAAGLPYYHPHSFRHTVALHGKGLRQTEEEWEAYCANFGHSSPAVTRGYGAISPHRQHEIMTAMATRGPATDAQPIAPVRLEDEQVRLILDGLRQRALEGG